MEKSSHNKEMETNLLLLCSGKMGTRHERRGRGVNDHVCRFRSPLRKREGCLGSLCRVTKKDLCRQRVSQTFWLGRSLHLVSKLKYIPSSSLYLACPWYDTASDDEAQVLEIKGV